MYLLLTDAVTSLKLLVLCNQEGPRIIIMIIVIRNRSIYFRMHWVKSNNNNKLEVYNRFIVPYWINFGAEEYQNLFISLWNRYIYCINYLYVVDTHIIILIINISVKFYYN